MLLARWEEAAARGEDPDPQTHCGDDLLWLPALRERIARQKRLRGILAMPGGLRTGHMLDDRVFPGDPFAARP